MLNKVLQYHQDGRINFTGTSMTVKVSKRFETYGMLSVTETVHTLAIFEIQIDGGEPKGFFLPATIEMVPSDVVYVTEDGRDFALLTFKKGDLFMKSNRVVKRPYLAYVIFTEFVEKGYIPSFINYEQRAFLFDIVQEITGSSIPAEHAVFELIFAHLNRDEDNVQIPYRLTDMKKPPVQLGLKDVAHATTSTTAKLSGGYLADSLTVALLNNNENTSPIEELLRN